MNERIPDGIYWKLSFSTALNPDNDWPGYIVFQSVIVLGGTQAVLVTSSLAGPVNAEQLTLLMRHFGPQ